MGTDLVRVFDGGFGVAGRVADDDGRVGLGGRRSGAARDLDGDLVVDELARDVADLDLALDVVLLEAEVAALDGHQSAALDRTTQRLDLRRPQFPSAILTRIHGKYVTNAIDEAVPKQNNKPTVSLATLRRQRRSSIRNRKISPNLRYQPNYTEKNNFGRTSF